MPIWRVIGITAKQTKHDIGYLEKQITVTENMLLALERIRVELEAITRNPELMPTDKLLVANQALPESIKDQICQL